MDKRLEEMRFNTAKANKFFTKIMAFTTGPVELKEMIKNNAVRVLDVRDREDYDKGHIPTAVSMPRNEMDTRHNELSKDELYVVYCYNQQCHLGACACRFLAVNDYHAIHLDGGFDVWKNDFNFEVEVHQN